MSHIEPDDNAFKFKANFQTFLWKSFLRLTIGQGQLGPNEMINNLHSIALQPISEVPRSPAEAHLLHVIAEGVGTHSKM